MSGPLPLTAKPHLVYLDGLRGLAAIFVVLHHTFLQFPALPQAGWLTQGCALVFSQGHGAVDLFIVLSGFCLMAPVVRAGLELRGGAGLFLAKRARRILPPYLLAMALSLLLIWLFIGQFTGTHWDVSLPVRPLDFWSHLLLLQDVGQTTATRINHAFWSISVEWRIYFLFPLLVACWRRVGPLATTLLAGGASAVLWVGLSRLQRFFPDLNLEPWGICPHYLLLFTGGMLAASVAFGAAPRWPFQLPWGAAVAGATAVCLQATLRPSLLGVHLPWPAKDLLIGGWAFCLLVYVAQAPGSRRGADVVRALLGWRPLAFAGTFAYSIYLIHAPLLQLAWQYGVAPQGWAPVPSLWLLILGGTPFILGGSYLFFLACERPFLSVRAKAAVGAGAAAS